MTNEEAIRILKIAIEDSKEHIRFCFDIKGIEALNMAIKSLEAEPCEDLEREYEKSKALFHKVVAEDDCISREAALNLFNKSDVCRWETAWIRRKIEKLPSVTPTRPKGKWIDTENKEEWYAYEKKCSICGNLTLDYGNYCSSCGAEMRGDAE